MIINENTKVTLRLSAICVSAILGAAVWINRELHDVQLRLTRIETVLKIESKAGPPATAQAGKL